MGKLSIFVTGAVTVAAMALATVMAVAPTRHPAARSAAAVPTALRIESGGGSAPAFGIGEPGPVALAPEEPVVVGPSTPRETFQVTPTPVAVANPTQIQTPRNASSRAPVALAPAGLLEVGRTSIGAGTGDGGGSSRIGGSG